MAQGKKHKVKVKKVVKVGKHLPPKRRPIGSETKRKQIKRQPQKQQKPPQVKKTPKIAQVSGTKVSSMGINPFKLVDAIGRKWTQALKLTPSQYSKSGSPRSELAAEKYKRLQINVGPSSFPRTGGGGPVKTTRYGVAQKNVVGYGTDGFKITQGSRIQQGDTLGGFVSDQPITTKTFTEIIPGGPPAGFPFGPKGARWRKKQVNVVETATPLVQGTSPIKAVKAVKEKKGLDKWFATAIGATTASVSSVFSGEGFIQEAHAVPGGPAVSTIIKRIATLNKEIQAVKDGQWFISNAHRDKYLKGKVNELVRQENALKTVKQEMQTESKAVQLALPEAKGVPIAGHTVAGSWNEELAKVMIQEAGRAGKVERYSKADMIFPFQ